MTDETVSYPVQLNEIELYYYGNKLIDGQNYAQLDSDGVLVHDLNYLFNRLFLMRIEAVWKPVGDKTIPVWLNDDRIVYIRQ